MKQSSIIVLLTFLVSLASTNSSAHDIAVKNEDGVYIYYNWIKDKTELQVSFQGKSSSDYSNEYTGDIVIPEEVEYYGKAYRVTSIKSDAFSDCTLLKSIEIPKSITKIESRAFKGCTGLESVYISDLAAWCNIDIRWAFDDDGSSPLYYARHLFLNGNEVNGEIVIPDGVTTIGSFSFYGCKDITSLTIPKSLKEIEQYAFSGCTGLNSLHISDIKAWCNIDISYNHNWDIYTGNNPLQRANHLFVNDE
jgi:hypothetical protein